MTQTVVDLETPSKSVVAEPVALPSTAEGKPDSSFPSAVVLFALASFGMIGMVSRSETVAGKSHRADSAQPYGSGIVRVIGLLSPNPIFAEHIETQLRRAGYGVRTAGSASEIIAVTDPTTFLLMVVGPSSPRLGHATDGLCASPDFTDGGSAAWPSLYRGSLSV